MQKRSVTRRGFLGAAALLAATLGAPSILRAKSYARHPVRLFVGTAAAGSNDLVARLIAQPLSDMLGQPVAVENRPGGATTMSVGLVGNARPDGHTLLVSSSAAVATYIASATKPPNLVDDLSPIGMICDGAFIYAVHKDVSAKSTAEFIALLKSEPGKVRFGATGTGGGIHLSGALFQQKTGTEMTVIQYANAGMRLTELLANQTQLGIAGAAVLAQQVKLGALRPLFVAGSERTALFPDVPTGAEEGVSGLDGISNWFGLHGPKDLDPQIAADLNGMLQKALTNAKVQDGFAASGLFAVPGKPDDLVARMKKDVVVMTEVVNTGGIRIE
ncbi:MULTISPECIES: Bug family tripartite tricarboxylate transporter substrate binding protein [Rhizobium/Agrobacterium group]|uniref:Bug family tripartite tricarboxylate transporter substrate binding protein n=1 Tax=Rhizobium/Agrobacterium group TaxID=227290 RepID=UPI0009E8490B|nr:tripartite tricarboxylate transporter substrate binding protein [Rhizobium sp. Root483D2]